MLLVPMLRFNFVFVWCDADAWMHEIIKGVKNWESTCQRYDRIEEGDAVMRRSPTFCSFRVSTRLRDSRMRAAPLADASSWDESWGARVPFLVGRTDDCIWADVSRDWEGSVSENPEFALDVPSTSVINTEAK
jgi:hypothetical protein